MARGPKLSFSRFGKGVQLYFVNGDATGDATGEYNTYFRFRNGLELRNFKLLSTNSSGGIWLDSLPISRILPTIDGGTRWFSAGSEHIRFNIDGEVTQIWKNKRDGFEKIESPQYPCQNLKGFYQLDSFAQNCVLYKHEDSRINERNKGMFGLVYWEGMVSLPYPTILVNGSHIRIEQDGCHSLETAVYRSKWASYTSMIEYEINGGFEKVDGNSRRIRLIHNPEEETYTIELKRNELGRNMRMAVEDTMILSKNEDGSLHIEVDQYSNLEYGPVNDRDEWVSERLIEIEFTCDLPLIIPLKESIQRDLTNW